MFLITQIEELKALKQLPPVTERDQQHRNRQSQESQTSLEFRDDELLDVSKKLAEMEVMFAQQVSSL